MACRSSFYVTAASFIKQHFSSILRKMPKENVKNTKITICSEVGLQGPKSRIFFSTLNTYFDYIIDLTLWFKEIT